MSLTKNLFSKKVFLINLVLVGIMIGFVAAFAIFARSNNAGPAIAHADSTVRSSATQADIAVAKSVQSAFNSVAAAVLPSVVELDVLATQKTPSTGGDDFPWRFFFGNPDQAPGNPPKDYDEQGLGSGIIIRKDGKTVYVLTNNHVVENAKEITVKLYNKKECKGTLVGTDKRRDLAVVSFQADGFDVKPAVLGDSDALKVGDWAIAIGSPFGLVSSVTVGTVSAIGRDGGPDGNINDFIQTDASINRGNSGGALANIDGEVVGINTWIASNTGGSIGLGFSIPINNAVRAVNDIISKGSVSYGWLGVQLSDISKQTRAELKLEGVEGALISQIFLNGPAAKGGILPGDYITEIDGKKIASVEQLIRLVGDLRVGSKSSFALLRAGKKLTLTVTIDERKESSAAEVAKLWPGIDVVALDKDLSAELKVPKNTKGIVVVGVIAKSPAAALSMKQGDVITAINDKPVYDIAAFYQAVNDPKNAKIQFTILREGQTLSTLALVRK